MDFELKIKNIACLVNNVITAKSFSLERGMHQGESIAAIDALEVSIVLVKSNNNIKVYIFVVIIFKYNMCQ